jgi:hypothetical protein
LAELIIYRKQNWLEIGLYQPRQIKEVRGKYKINM